MITMMERMLTLEPELDSGGVGVGFIGSDLSLSIIKFNLRNIQQSCGDNSALTESFRRFLHQFQ